MNGIPGASGPDIGQLFMASELGWFRARACHEHDSVMMELAGEVDVDRARILDFGCGNFPVSAVSFALRHPDAQVVATDIGEIHVEPTGIHLLQQTGLDMPANIRFLRLPPSSLPSDLGGFDLIYSWSVFEHISPGDLDICFRLMHDHLARDGRFVLQIDDLYHSPRGSHLAHCFNDAPWHHLVRTHAEIHDELFSQPRSQLERDHLWRQFIELNRLCADDFLERAQEAGLELLRTHRYMVEGVEPPRHLLRQHPREALMTRELRAVFRKPARMV